ncbi:hypothetical protein [Bacteroides sp.]|uniref:hypothetical protein n=1 Tax=Bacteroides sp. TaxID=29523 RepID=UPI0026137026|nr:hypothetical protein [Bacteroides sp.]MDD3036391.1 hypothetical protein [Bacteroides sp.]
MSRIKERGLDYFPISVDFINDHVVRRLMKREGDSVLGILEETEPSYPHDETKDKLTYESKGDTDEKVRLISVNVTLIPQNV